MKRLDPRQVKSKEKLQDTYLKLLKQGEYQITINQLCKVANVGRPTFYRLYNDVTELRFDIHESLLLELKKSLSMSNPRPFRLLNKDDLYTNFTLLFQHILTRKDAYKVFCVDYPDGIFIEYVKNLIMQYVSEGIFYAEQGGNSLRGEKEIIISYIAGAYLEGIRWWIKGNFNMPVEEIATILVDLSIYGPYIEKPKLMD